MKKDVRSMKLTMQLKSRSYDIILKAGCLANLHQFTNVQHRKVFVLTDSGVPAAYAQTVAAQCPEATVYTIPQGEGSKCLKVYGQVLQAMLTFGMDRRDLLVAVGGGVVGDLGGFCAASYMRGIDFVNCPTTVLAQVDSSIGGKTAIDLGETKNIVGAFWQPKVVLVDFDTLKTLPRRQVVNGLAEALKTGLIGDPQLFALFECEHPEENIEQIVYRSLKFKKKIVEQDEREGSVRACLNFGHTIGHGIEAASDFALGHGSCVAAGLCCMLRSCVALGWTDPALAQRVERCVEAHGLPTDTQVDHQTLMSYMTHDKKRHGDSMNVVVARGAEDVVVRRVSLDELARIVELGCGIKE